MADLVCTKFDEYFLLINRRTTSTVKLTNKHAYAVKELYEAKSGDIPSWLIKGFELVDYQHTSSSKTWSDFIFREHGKFEFKRASYEITESCNFKCIHCYLDSRVKKGVNSEERVKIIDIVESSGCVWLQLTGGELAVDPFFKETYKYSHQKGLLIELSTNGSLLIKHDLIDLFGLLPPHRITVSLYGASERTHKNMTQSSVPLKKIIKGLQDGKNAGLRMRVNIILTKHNKHELSELTAIPENIGIDYHVYKNIHPTLDAKLNAVNELDLCVAKQSDLGVKESEWSRVCFAGKNFFHIDAYGKASICKILRKPFIELLKGEGLELFSKQSFGLTTPMRCLNCKSYNDCKTCPPVLELYKKCEELPSHVCSEFGTYQF